MRFLVVSTILVIIIFSANLYSQPTFSGPIDVESIGATTIFAKDLDNDGDIDIAAFEGGRHNGGAKSFAWFENTGNNSNWPKHPFHSTISPGPFTGDSEPVDLNNDGFMDFVLTVDQHNTTGNSFVYWWENPMGSGGLATDDWIPHIVAQNMTNCFHMQGLDVVDMDGDGKLDIVARNLGTSAVRIYFQNTLDNWTERVIPTRRREGQKVADLDRDGRPDIILNGFWLAAPPNPRTGTFLEFDIESDYYLQTNAGLNNSVKIDVADLDGDGIDDVLFSVAEGSPLRLAWFKCPNNPRTQPWVETIIENNFEDCHQAILTDLDLDGDLDIAGGFAFNSNGVKNWYNDDGLGGSWTSQIVDGSGHMYSEVVADIDNDGDMDLIGPKKYTGIVRIYINELSANNSGPITPPSQLNISSNDSLVLKLDWLDNSNNETGFEIWRAENGGTSALYTSVGVGVTTFTDNNTNFSTTYSYEVRGKNTTNNSSFTNAVSYTTKADPATGPVSSPGALSISSPDSLALVLNWTDNSSNETGFEVWRAENGGAFAPLATTAPNTTTYTDQSTVYATTYSYQVRGVNSTNQSVFTNQVSFTTKAGPDVNSGLLAYWKMDNATGTVASEAFNQFPGTLNSGVTWNTDGQYDGAAEFNGTTGRMNVGLVDVNPNALTISFWMKADDFDQVEGRFISKASGVNGSEHFWMVSTINSTRLRFRLQTTNGGTTTLVSPSVLVTNTWYMVTATYDQNMMKIYLDCNLVASVAKQGAIVNNSTISACIGNQPVGTGERPFDGLIDEMRIYDRALDANDVCDLMNYQPQQLTLLNIKVWLEGAYDSSTGDMSATTLQQMGLLPGQTPSNQIFVATPAGQPYNVSPWNYQGTEGSDWANNDYTASDMDWVLVAIRSTPAKSDELFRGVGMLQTDGQIKMVTPVTLAPTTVDNSYLYVAHRNHISVVSPTPVSLDPDGRTLSYDFTLQNSWTPSTGFGQKEITTGVWGMYTGDMQKMPGNSSDINSSDKQLWSVKNGTFGQYASEDLNMDNDISALDNVLWSYNNGIFSFVED